MFCCQSLFVWSSTGPWLGHYYWFLVIYTSRSPSTPPQQQSDRYTLFAALPHPTTFAFCFHQATTRFQDLIAAQNTPHYCWGFRCTGSVKPTSHQPTITATSDSISSPSYPPTPPHHLPPRLLSASYQTTTRFQDLIVALKHATLLLGVWCTGIVKPTSRQRTVSSPSAPHIIPNASPPSFHHGNILPGQSTRSLFLHDALLGTPTTSPVTSPPSFRANILPD